MVKGKSLKAINHEGHEVVRRNHKDFTLYPFVSVAVKSPAITGLARRLLLFLPFFLATLACEVSLPTPPTFEPYPTMVVPTWPSGQNPEAPQPGGNSPYPSGQLYFDPSASNQVAPSDILNEIAFFGSGGGDDWECLPENQTQINLIDPPALVEWLGSSEIKLCGRPGEIILISVFHHGVFIQNGNTTADSNGKASYLFLVTESMQTGDWVIKIDSVSGHLELTVNVFRPSAPRVYRINTRLFLYGFAPNEVIRLFAYQVNRTNGIGHLAGWTEYPVDSFGELTVDIPNNELIHYYAVSALSGEVYETTRNPKKLKATEPIVK